MNELQKAKEKALNLTEKKQHPAVTLLTAVGLTAILCVGGTYSVMNNQIQESKPVITMKGDIIDVGDFYTEIKKTQKQAAQASVLLSLMSRIFEKEYGKDVTPKDVEKLYKEKEQTLGDGFETELSNLGYTPDTYRDSLRLDLLMEKAYFEHAKKEVTEKEIEEQYNKYFTNVVTKVSVFSTDEKAQQAKNDFDNTESESSVQDYTFNSDSDDLPFDVMLKAAQTDVGQITDVIQYIDPSTRAEYYFVVKVLSKEEKPSLESIKDKMKDKAIEVKASDKEFQNQILSNYFEKYNVKIKDKDFADLLSEYTK